MRARRNLAIALSVVFPAVLASADDRGADRRVRPVPLGTESLVRE